MTNDKPSPIGFRNQSGALYLKIVFLLFLVLSVCCGPCWGQFKYNSQALVPFDPAFKMGQLDNGIRYIVYTTDIQKNKAFFYDLFNIGNCQENPNEHGTAHFIEHLLAYINENGFDKYSDYLRTITKIDKVNQAGTGPGGTYYALDNIPSQRRSTLDSMLLILRDIPFQLNTGHNVEKQRKIVLAELKMRNTADSNVEDSLSLLTLNGTKYSELHNYKSDTTDVSHISSEQLKQFHAKWYRPDHLTVIVIGDFDAVKMEAMIKRTFSSIPKFQSLPSIVEYPSIPELKKPIVYIDRNQEVESGKIEIHFRQDKVFPFNQKQFRNEMIDRLITNMFQKRLDQACLNSNATFNGATIAHENSYYLSVPRFGEYIITAQSDNPGNGLVDLLKMREQIRRYGFMQNELQQTESTLLNSFHSFLTEKSILPCSEYFYILYGYVISGVIRPSNQYQYTFAKQVFPSITLKEVNARFNRIIADQQPAISITCTETKDFKCPSVSEIMNLVASVRKQTIAPYNIHTNTNLNLFDKKITSGKVITQNSNKVLNTTEWILSNGMKVVIKTTDFKNNEIQFEGLRNKPLLLLKKEYLPDLLFGDKLLQKMGIDRFTPSQIEQLLYGKMLSVETLLLPQARGITGEKQGIFGYTDPKEFETCLQLIHLHFNYQQWNDEFLQEEMDLVKKKATVITPTTVMSDTIAYYSSTKKDLNSGIMKNMRFLSPERLKKIFYTVFGNPADFTFFFVGNLKAEAAKPLIEKYLGSLSPIKNQGKEAELLDTTALHANDSWKTGRVSHQFSYPMQTPVANINIGCQGKIENDSKNLLCRYITSSLLGRRSNEFIREKNEATYFAGVMNYIAIRKEDSGVNLSVRFQTNPKIADQIRQKTIEEFKRFMTQGPEEKDFNIIKERTIQSRTNDLKSNQWWADSALYEYYLQGKDITNTYLDEIKNITLNDITRFSMQLFAQGNLVDIMMLPKQ